MPAGELVTVPLPVPAGATVRVKVCGVKLAVTVVAAETVTTQAPVPVQPPPLQPVKVEPAAGGAGGVTAGPPRRVPGQGGTHAKAPRPPGSRSRPIHPLG